MGSHQEQRTLKGIATRFSVRISARELGNRRESLANIPALAEGSQSVTFQNPLEAIPMSRKQLTKALRQQSKDALRSLEVAEYQETIEVLSRVELTEKFSRVEVN